MPRFDGTGPEGRGPMTGWGRGFCNPSEAGVAPGAAPAVEYRGFGRGRGLGQGRGLGRGRGRTPGQGRTYAMRGNR